MIIDTVLNDQAKGVWKELNWEPSSEQFQQLISLQNLGVCFFLLW